MTLRRRKKNTGSIRLENGDSTTLGLLIKFHVKLMEEFGPEAVTQEGVALSKIWKSLMRRRSLAGASSVSLLSNSKAVRRNDL